MKSVEVAGKQNPLVIVRNGGQKTKKQLADLVKSSLADAVTDLRGVLNGCPLTRGPVRFEQNDPNLQQFVKPSWRKVAQARELPAILISLVEDRVDDFIGKSYVGESDSCWLYSSRKDEYNHNYDSRINVVVTEFLSQSAADVITSNVGVTNAIPAQ